MASAREPDYYEILQVHPKASAAVIKKAYRTLLLEMGNHPDQGGSPDVASRMNEAYAVLSHPERRAEYDRHYFGEATPPKSRPSAGAKRPEPEPERASPPPKTPPKPSFIVLCPRCQTKNRVKSQDWLALAHCSRCGQALKQLPHPLTQAWDGLRRALRWRPPRSQALAIAVSLFLFSASGVALWSVLGRPAVDPLEATDHLRQEGKLSQAANLLQRALVQSPANPRLHEKLGDVYMSQLLYEPALDEYSRAIALNPENSYLYTLKGNALVALNRLPEAEACYQQALHRDPDEAAAQVALGNLYAKQQRFHDAERLYHLALHDRPDADVFYNLGMVYAWDNQYAQARQAFNQALIQDPNHRASMVSLASLYYAHGHYNQAAAQLVKANQLQHGDLDLHLRLADIYERTGHLKEAVAEWRVCEQQGASSPALMARARKEIQRLTASTKAG